MAGTHDITPDRRGCLRHKVHAPAFASFDGVTGGVILDLSEQGLAMQTAHNLQPHRPVQVRVDLADPPTHLETTGYIAWADALGRAGVRFSELPDDARRRLEQWLTVNAGARSYKAPKFTVGAAGSATLRSNSLGTPRQPLAISLEPETEGAENGDGLLGSRTVQYEFGALSSDLNSALRLIAERARSLTRGTGAAIAISHNGAMICRASIAACSPALGAKLNVDSGFSGECVRHAKPMRCDDVETDPRVNVETCRRLGIRSIVAAPIQYEREVIGLLEVFSSETFAFDEGDVAIVERLGQTVLLTVTQCNLRDHLYSGGFR